MPLWAFDQFQVSEVGQEPDLLSNLDEVGHKRADGASNYIKAMKSVIDSFSTDKVYTLCVWGVSQFLDVMQWTVCGGILPGVKLDFNKLCGSPPVYLTIYELGAGNGQDQRHVPSRKNQFFRVGVWSALRPPQALGSSEASVTAPAEECQSIDAWFGVELGYDASELVAAPAAAPAVETCDLLGFASADTSSPPPSSSPLCADLLGMDLGAPAASSPAKAPAPGSTENVDLLGLF